MRRLARVLVVLCLIGTALLVKPSVVAGQVDPGRLAQCLEVGFSLEEDFVTQGPEPFDETAIWGSGETNSLVVVLRAIFTWRLHDNEFTPDGASS